jgi:sulfotransferase
MRKHFLFQAGLPRTGSTVLSAILDQNPDIYAGQHSPVCQMMWDIQGSCENSAREQLAASNRTDFQGDLLSRIPDLYYRHVSEPTVVDKCMVWTLEENFNLIKRYITPDPKIVVLTRPLEEIIESFENVNRRAGIEIDAHLMWIEGTAPVMRSNEGVQWARENNSGEFLFIEYADFMADPTTTLERVYNHYGLPAFNHDFNNIVCHNPEDESVHGVAGMHTVRPELGLRHNAISKIEAEAS